MSNDTDYKKPHGQVYDLLPNVYRSDVNKAVSRNIFERFLSKNELVNVVGTITDEPLDPLRLPENTVHRQNFQLQPLLYSKIATVDHISSFKDLIRELERLGVNYERLDEWLSAEQFNFAPPIDIDKVINYASYYWLDDSDPQYITIKNRVVQLTVIVQQAFDDFPGLEELAQQYEEEEDPVQKQLLADQIEAIYPGFVELYEEYRYLQRNLSANLVNINGWDGIVDGLSVVEINTTSNAFIVEGDYATILNSLPVTVPNIFPSIRIKNGPNAGIYTMNVAALFNPPTNQTIIEVVEPIPTPGDLTGLVDAGTYDSPIDGLSIEDVTTDSFDVKDDMTSVFESLITTFDNSIQGIIGSNTFEMNGDVAYKFDLYTKVTVYGSANAGVYTLSGVTYNSISDKTEIVVVETIPDTLDTSGYIAVDFEVVGGPNEGTYTINTYSYDSFTNRTTITTETLPDSVTVTGLINAGRYDYLLNNDPNIPNPFGFTIQDDPWSGSNRWVHIADVPSSINLTTLHRAEQPIIEYEPYIELNEWSCVQYAWQYSSNGETGHAAVDFQPSDDEVLLANFTNDIITTLTTTTFEIVATEVNPKLTPGTEVTIEYDDGDVYSYHTIQNITYDLPNNKAVVEVDVVINSSYANANLQPIRYTSQGDDWKGFTNHWLYVERLIPTPCNNQTFSSAYDPDSLTYDPTRFQELNAAGASVNWYHLDQMTILDHDDVRVYVRGERLYGAFSLGYFNGVDFEFNGPVKNAVWFNDPVLSGTIRVEVGPAAEEDEPKRSVQVKINVDDATLTTVSLVQYVKTEQIKTSTHQYPLFNMFNLDGTTAFKASALWKFNESPDSIVNPLIGLRIVADYQQSVYTFEQLLLEEDNGRMYAYKKNGTFETVWRTDDDHREYVPEYIDTDYQPVPIGDPEGDWELPKQMTCNLEHENRVLLTTTDLFTHFNTIINSQDNPPGFNGSLQNRWRLLSEPQYGAGGTIKEFSDGFDTFMSSLFVTKVNMIRLIDFAKREYSNSIRRIRTLLTDNLTELLTTTDPFVLNDIVGFINESIINSYEEDDYFERVYGDTTSYDPETGLGVRNWIATLPRFGMIPAVAPKMLIEDRLEFVELTHHDGHKSSPSLQSSTISKLSRSILDQPGTIQGLSGDRPDVSNTLLGMVYYATDTKRFYKCVVSSYGTLAPTTLPNGTYWYDTVADELKRKQGNSFVIVDREDCWVPVVFDVAYAGVLFEIEKRLYAVSQNQPIVFDVRNVQADVDYNDNEVKQFAKYVAEQQIADPFASVYVSDNAFSWNYSSVDVNDYQVVTQPPSWSTQPPSTWFNIYESVYGTRNPQLEPWILQNYDLKPLWWDQEYNTDPSRRWTRQMWENILGGYVPAGREYPTGVVSNGIPGDVGFVPGEGTTIGGLETYTVVPVNITDSVTTDTLYRPDDLLPPYYASLNPLDADVITYGVILPTYPDQTLAADPFVYGQNGFTEDVWRTSIEFPYALTRMSYITQPMRFTYFTFGTQLEEIDGLQVDVSTNTIPSHRDAIFHGDMIGNEIFHFNGINQWYVNFLRFSAKNLNTSDFRDLWTTWRPTLSYQMSSFVDARSVDLRNDTFYFDDADYNLRTKRTPGFEDHYLESLSVVVNEMGSSTLRRGVRVPTGKGDDWKFRVTTANPQNVPLTIYGVDTSATPTTFNILRQEVNQDSWDHYPIDRTQTYTFIPGTVVSSLGADYEGIQGLVNFIDGYVAYMEDQGFVFNDSNYNALDLTYSRVDNWQLQIEKMIQQVYVGMVADTLPLYFVGKWGYTTVDTTTNVFTASAVNDFNFTNGEQIQFHSTGNLPQPLLEHTMYEMVNIDNLNRTFQIAELGSTTPIDITSMGRGTTTFGMYRIETTIPQSFFELNPFKFNVVYDNEAGIIADIHEGSFEDITSEQGIYDQYGRPILNNNTRVYRGDKRSVIKMFETVPDDITVGSQLHIGGMHLFLDGYEHAIMFNNQSINGGLLFDEFLGSQITKVIMNVRTNYSKTFRPNVGGRYLLDDEQRPNIEASVGELQHMYDAYLADEDSDLVKAGRELLGFETRDYFDDIGVTPKSQFLFYRGLIQQKGSFNAIKAFINLRLFIDANVDDYWAYKVGDFGDAREKEFPRLNLIPSDTENNMLLLRFLTDKDNAPLRDYIDIELTDSERWSNQPQQLKEIFEQVPNQHFEAEVTDYVSINGATVAGQQYIKLPVKCDDVTIVTAQTNRTYEFTTTGDGPYTATLNERIMPNAGSLTVYISRDDEPFKQVPVTEIIEEDDGVTVQVLRYVDNNDQVAEIELGDTIQIHVGNATLVEDTHYTRLNSQLVFFDTGDQVQDVSTFEQVSFFCHNPAESKLNPAKLLDTKSRVSLENVTLWNPCLGHHYHNANIVVDQRSSDPAYYTHSLVTGDINRDLAWLDRSEGFVWWNEDVLSYKPYQDNKINGNFNQRLKLWGQLEDWSEIELYEWVKSPVHPSEYVDYTIEQQDEGETISGTPRQTLFKRVRNGTTQLFDQSWVEVQDFIVTNILTPVDGTTFAVDTSYVDDGAIFELYENGILKNQGLVSGGQIDISVFAFDTSSFMSIRVPAYQPTDEELEFDPDVEDDGSIDVQFKLDYKYVQEDRVSANGVDVDSTYYFWARHTATSHYGLSLQTAEQQLTKIPQSYMVFDNLLKEEPYTSDTGIVQLPNRYTRCAVRGLVNKVSTADRFILQFTRNFILRDDVDDVFNEAFLRNKHSQWKMFRQRQKFNIDIYLWNKLTEACSGRLLTDSSQPVPSLDYVLYDERFGTQTRYGMESGQSFVDATRGIEIILSEINNPEYDLYPVDREAFLEQYKFDTPENIEAAMTTIYQTFLPEHVNRIWFAVLFEALAANSQFRGLFKTSWVQLDGVRLLDTSGVLQ